MRLSVDRADPGYAAWMRLRKRIGTKVFLDGVEVQRCVTADDVAGEVVMRVLDENGRVKVADGKVVNEVLRGHVRIELP